MRCWLLRSGRVGARCTGCLLGCRAQQAVVRLHPGLLLLPPRLLQGLKPPVLCYGCIQSLLAGCPKHFLLQTVGAQCRPVKPVAAWRRRRRRRRNHTMATPAAVQGQALGRHTLQLPSGMERAHGCEQEGRAGRVGDGAGGWAAHYRGQLVGTHGSFRHPACWCKHAALQTLMQWCTAPQAHRRQCRRRPVAAAPPQPAGWLTLRGTPPTVALLVVQLLPAGWRSGAAPWGASALAASLPAVARLHNVVRVRKSGPVTAVQTAPPQKAATRTRTCHVGMHPHLGRLHPLVRAEALSFTPEGLLVRFAKAARGPDGAVATNVAGRRLEERNIHHI